MTDREKVIKGLECCIKRDPDDHTRCGECPYQSTMCGNRLKIEALALLKAQEPRVMTLEEVRNNFQKPAWFESHGTFRGKKGFWVLLGKTYAGSFTKKMMCATGMTDTELGLDAYGEVWRCWTSRPTDAQMEATPWE